MRLNRELGGALAAAAIAAIALATPSPAFASVNPSNCIYSFGNSPWGDHLPYRVAATCDDTTNSGWHAYAICENTQGVDRTVNGFEVYGDGTSIAQCSVEASLAGYGVVNG